MTLNTASAVAVDFASGRRGVRLLAGEAFFGVRRDPDHLFRVAGRFGVVTVKGTVFAVHIDPEGVVRSLSAAAGVTVTRLPGGLLILR